MLCFRVRAFGATMELGRGKIVIAPREVVPAALVDELREHKAAVIEFLKAEIDEMAGVVAEVPTPRANPDEALGAQPIPKPQPAPPAIAWRDDPLIPEQVRFEIERWEPLLKAHGWGEERIWRRPFWPHSAEHPRGLPSIIDAGDRIEHVDEQYIWIYRASGMQQKFRKE